MEAKCKKCKGTGIVKIVNSRSKGGSYERRIAKKFSEWCGFEVRRTPSSGALMKTGDIFPVVPENMVRFPFSIELKNRESWDFKELFDRKNKVGIFSYWKQCTSDADMSNRVPMLVFTKNGSPDYCMTDNREIVRIISGREVGSVVTSDGYIVFELEALFSFSFSVVVDHVRGC